ncbi:proton translocating ATP synthase, F1 alpha subunit [Jonquetella anthropi DSM 22815]|uniref:ATP synthase subunit alpha n=1 Tax=Jonquetella anthropi DSM 22815 TaxID=885272 RepID=H0UJZ4_9BACT|nr:F0F1 ATP synthase subunit alpha [Jonquetella anthropi]EEX48560.1 ATP synthase F1, alpha subunit [Jonquetella anthropi E3_33 E1]EHM13004.1 proton translocating ATP synthase, F1 alpha subunit [Jonquetella anthropi DSM 22815]
MLSDGIIEELRERIRSFDMKLDARETGQVVSLADGIATVYGLDRVTYGELVVFEDDSLGMAMNLESDRVGVVLFSDGGGLREGTLCRRGGQAASVSCGDGLIGRVVNPLGEAIDGGAPIVGQKDMPVEREASGVMSRKPVNVPLKTGILAVDALVPVGRGQRELIIGDRQTGKTTIAVDAILNQKDQNVICIYCAIGQKNSSIAQIHASLRAAGALDYTFIVSSPASDSPSLQYLAPYAATAMGEYFMDQGRDVLIIYDDLSKHAVAYRALSLLLRRSPGREAYPGDVFYLHSRLLERSCRLEDHWGGGSMTALPIIETQAGDVSAYIPTNVISITDGQIYLESHLFRSGVRPAVNTGLSVSRVGGAAQPAGIRALAGNLRVTLARFAELEVFTQFAGDLDDATREALDSGHRLTEVLKQTPGSSLSTAGQLVTLYYVTSGGFSDVPLAHVRDFARDVRKYLSQEDGPLMQELERGEKLTDGQKEALDKRLAAFKAHEAPSWQK